MEIKNSLDSGKGVFTTQSYKKNDIVYTLTGNISSKPTRESIHIGNNQHIYDAFGIFINHSFTPNIRVHKTNLMALRDIKENEEIRFNYNHCEINMASPFYVDGILVGGITK